MDKNFRYVKHGKYLVCLDQSILDVFRQVFLGFERHRLGSIGFPKALGQAAVRVVIRDRLRLLGTKEVFEFPAFGHIGITVHRGFKVFDLGQHHVTKVFAPGTDPEEAREEIRVYRRASNIAAAPRFVAEDPNHEWYREEYICGLHATEAEVRNGVDVMDYYPQVESCLLDLVACNPPQYVATLEHIDRHADTSFQDRWIKNGQDAGRVGEIAAYVEEMAEWLRKQQKPDQLQLVLTHGDFSLVNAIATDDGLRFIDWEGVTTGGLYSDVFHFLFAERYYNRIADSFLEEMAQYTTRYRQAALARFPGLSDAANLNLTFARRLYYLERISLMLDRSVTSNLCDVVGNSIATFRACDKDAGDVAA